MALKVTVKVGGNEFMVDGDVTFAEVLPPLETWLQMVAVGNQAEVDAITTRVRAMKASLGDAVDDASKA